MKNFVHSIHNFTLQFVEDFGKIGLTSQVAFCIIYSIQINAVTRLKGHSSTEFQRAAVWCEAVTVSDRISPSSGRLNTVYDGRVGRTELHR